jgi:DNA-binding Lrp family transcriptional regulator
VIFDELDRALLRELQNYARQSDAELAAATGTTPEIVAERLYTLHQRRVIRGYHAVVDPVTMGRVIQALVVVRIRTYVSHGIESFRDWAMAAPETVNLFATSGSGNFVLHVALPTTDDLYSFVAERIVSHPAVLEAQTSLVFEHVRGRSVEPFEGQPPGRHGADIHTPGEYVS